MASPDNVEIARRYDGIVVGPRLEYSFETQGNIPIDGGNQLLRNLSPFTLRFVPPPSLLEAAGLGEITVGGTNDVSVNLITAAMQSNAVNGQVATELERATAIGVTFEILESYVATGQFVGAGGSQTEFSTIADAVVAADIALQLKRMLAVPPLTLLVNPETFSINYTNIQNYTTRTRTGYVFERWGEEQPTMSFTGWTGGFISGMTASPGTDPIADGINGKTSFVSGLQAASRRDSAAFQNFTALIHFFRNNGYIFDNINKTEAHQFIGAIAIDYDQWTYVGHFETFDFTEEETEPHRLQWNAEFRVDQMFDHAQSPLVVLPQIAPTPSPSTPSGGTGGTTQSISDVMGNLSNTFQNSTDPDSEFGVIPFELLE